MSAFWVALGAVFLAELGDKSQILTLTFATRYRPSQVLVVVTIVAAVLQGLSVLVGSAVAEALPTDLLQLIAGFAFLGFAYWTWRGDDDDEEEGHAGRTGRFPVVTMLVAFFLAEFGDKTMLATVTLATTQDWLGTWIGATAGMVGANVIAVVVGRQLGERLRPRTVTLVSAGFFLLFGIVLLVQGITNLMAG